MDLNLLVILVGVIGIITMVVVVWKKVDLNNNGSIYDELVDLIFELLKEIEFLYRNRKDVERIKNHISTYIYNRIPKEVRDSIDQKKLEEYLDPIVELLVNTDLSIEDIKTLYKK